MQAFSFRKRSQDADKALRVKLEQINLNLRFINHLELQTTKDSCNDHHKPPPDCNRGGGEASTSAASEDRLKFDVDYPESIVVIKEEYNDDGDDDNHDGTSTKFENQSDRMEAMSNTTPTVLNDFYSSMGNGYQSDDHKMNADELMDQLRPQNSFECNICHKSFEYLSKLESHKAVHTDDRPYPCGVCGQRFRLPYHRKRHYVIHTGVKAFKCDICFKRFSRKDHLKLHHGTHFDRTATIKEAKPYKCNLCDRTFGKRHHLSVSNFSWVLF